MFTFCFDPTPSPPLLQQLQKFSTFVRTIYTYSRNALILSFGHESFSICQNIFIISKYHLKIKGTVSGNHSLCLNRPLFHHCLCVVGGRSLGRWWKRCSSPFSHVSLCLGCSCYCSRYYSPLVLVLAYTSIFRISWYFSPLCWCFVPISHTLVFALLVLFLIFPVLFPLVLVLNILLSAFLVSFLYGADTVDPHFIKCQSLVSYIFLVLLPLFMSILFHVLFTVCGKVL